MHSKLGQAFVTHWGSFILLQIRATSLLQVGENVVTNWDSYYKLRATIITKQGSYYKLGQNVLQIEEVLQIRAIIITNWAITLNSYAKEIGQNSINNKKL